MIEKICEEQQQQLMRASWRLSTIVPEDAPLVIKEAEPSRGTRSGGLARVSEASMAALQRLKDAGEKVANRAKRRGLTQSLKHREWAAATEAPATFFSQP